MKLNNSVISVKKFVGNYLQDESEVAKKIRTHESLKDYNNKFVKRTTFRAVKANPEYVANGIILLVQDDFQLIPYVNPHLIALKNSLGALNDTMNNMRKKRYCLENLSENFSILEQLMLEKQLIDSALIDLEILDYYKEESYDKQIRRGKKNEYKRK